MLTVLQSADGVITKVKEGLDTNKKAMVNYHSVCMALWNDEATKYAHVQLVNEDFGVIKEEIIDKSLDAKPEEQPTEQPQGE